MTMNDYVWQMYDYVWLYMTMYDYVWLHITLYFSTNLDFVYLCLLLFTFVNLCWNDASMHSFMLNMWYFAATWAKRRLVLGKIFGSFPFNQPFSSIISNNRSLCLLKRRVPSKKIKTWDRKLYFLPAAVQGDQNYSGVGSAQVLIIA